MLKTIKKRVETGVLVTAIVVPLALCVFAFLGLAVYFSFRESLPPNLAALVTAACGIVAIALVLIIARIAGARRSAGRRESSRPDRAELGDDLEAYLREHVDPVMGEWVRNNPDKAAIATLGLGIAAGYSEQFRRVLMDFYARYSESESMRRSRSD